MKFKWLYFVLSGLVIVPGLISLVLFGLRPSIDFTGGTLWEIKLEKDGSDLGRFFSDKNIEINSLNSSGQNQFLIKAKPWEDSRRREVRGQLESQFGSVEELRFETVGPLMGRELLIKTVLAVILASIFILIYVAYQFKDKLYGLSAILAMFHDSLVILGSFSLLGHFFGIEVDTLFVTAVLTVLSFSVHDTVVVYDRIRESVRHFPETPFENLVDKSINETLVRSLNNSLTVVFMLLALFLLGGQTIHWFALALLIGLVSGTYSSTFTAAPLLVIFHNYLQGKNRA